ncbi:alpha-amylase family glycosyl hydrolase [Ekhidna sp.]|uniref:alpha-amylase family glycosyl hydrolase n=1 Tax=Ekhidna sp. TaxID=2608089 RepID=UPI003CCC0B8E
MRFTIIVTLLFGLLNGLYAQNVAITFNVNMSYQIEQGKFSPSTEFVDIAGTFNGWGGTLNKLSDHDGDSVWSVTLNNFNPGQTIEFKFRYNGDWDDREEFPGAGNNRTHTVGSDDESLGFWYNDEEPPSGPAVAGIASSSTFTYTGGSIFFEEAGSGQIDNIEWTFEGGLPATSSENSISVTYSNPGTYDVSIKVSNDFSDDELILEDYITVEDQSMEDLGWWNEAVFYEIFVRSFYDSDGDGIGDFQGIIEKLDYLNDGNPETQSDLGITGIWLMPIHDSPSYHGYDVNDYRSINPDYGSMDDFKEFLEEAHKRGIKVIIDLVLNHSSSQIDWFQNARSSPTAEKRNWYRWSDTRPSYSGPWGQQVWHEDNTGYYYGLFWGGMPDLNYEAPELKEEMFDITRYWLEDIGIDGFRLDAVKYIIEEESSLEDLPATHAFWREWVAVTKSSNPEALSVGEAWTSTEKIVPYVVNDGMDFCFDFDLANSIINAVKSGDGNSLTSQVNKVINSYPYYQFGTFTTNHDMNRLMNELSSNEDLVKMAAGIYLTMPGIPFVYYGEEVGMTGIKPDENIRRPMSWSAETKAGFTEGNPWNEPASNYETNNVEVGRTDNTSVFNTYRKLIQLRSASKALQIGDYHAMNLGSSEVIGYKRVFEKEQVITLANLSTEPTTVSVDISDIDDSFSDEPALVDVFSNDRIDIENKASIEVTLRAKSVKVLIGGDLTLGSHGVKSITVYPNPASEQIVIKNQGAFQFQLAELKGKVLIEGEHTGDYIVDTSLLSKGVYLLHIKSGDYSSTRKIIIK